MTCRKIFYTPYSLDLDTIYSSPNAHCNTTLPPPLAPCSFPPLLALAPLPLAPAPLAPYCLPPTPWPPIPCSITPLPLPPFFAPIPCPPTPCPHSLPLIPCPLTPCPPSLPPTQNSELRTQKFIQHKI